MASIKKMLLKFNMSDSCHVYGWQDKEVGINVTMQHECSGRIVWGLMRGESWSSRGRISRLQRPWISVGEGENSDSQSHACSCKAILIRSLLLTIFASFVTCDVLRLKLSQVTSRCAIAWPGIFRILTKPPVISFPSHCSSLFPLIPLFWPV